MQERLRTVWRSMKYRCESSYAIGYENYGGRGIKVCDEWQDYETFKKWAMANGYDKNAPKGECTIDRINANGNYEPANCRFISQREQCRNKRNTNYIEIEGIQKPFAAWAEESNVPVQVIKKRYYHGLRGKQLLKPCKVIYGREIKNLRKLRGNTPLGEVAWESGISYTVLDGMERGRYIPGHPTCEKLSKYYKLPIQAFLCRIEEE